MQESPPLRILVIQPDQWPRALLRAELIERGYDAVGAADFIDALICHPQDPERGPVRLILVDQAALGGSADELLASLRARHSNALMMLLRGHAFPAPSGNWDGVVTRPVTIGELASEIEARVPIRCPDHARMDA